MILNMYVYDYMYMCICVIVPKNTAQRIFMKWIQPYTECLDLEPEHYQHPDVVLIPSSPLLILIMCDHYSDV